MNALKVSSEISRLQKVLVHAPDESISRVTPTRAKELLFDDIVHLEQMQQEHGVFVDVLKLFCGEENVLHMGDLIREGLDQSPEGREKLINVVGEFEELPRAFIDELTSMDNSLLAKTLITGYSADSDTIYFDPVPNFIFTRDIAAFVNDHVVITKASRAARHRENLLTRFAFWRHEIFSELKRSDHIINLNVLDDFPPNRRGDRVSVEGGDMMMLNEHYLLIGVSERSTAHGFHSLKKALFANDAIDHVVMVSIPAERSFMHIDTVFTQLSETHMMGFKPIVNEGLNSYIQVHERHGDVREYYSIKQFLRAEIHPEMEFIYSGGGISPYQEREQWTDSCNLLTLKPGVALSYDRNVHTEKALQKFGYDIIGAEELLQVAKTDSSVVSNLEKTIIALPSGELSRGRGGAHCMSCPILRA